MDELQQRADLVDERLKDLSKTLSQLKQGLPIINQSNANLNQAFEPKGQSSAGIDGCLSYDETKKVLSGLKSIKQKLAKYEEERKREKEHLSRVRDNMRQELLAIKKEIMTENFRQTPEEFRKDLERQLLLIRQELVKVEQLKQNQNQNQTININGPPLTMTNRDALNKVKTELISIRKEMAGKLSQLKKYEQFEKDMDGYKDNIRKKLLEVKSIVQKYEQELTETKAELARLQTENEDYR